MSPLAFALVLEVTISVIFSLIPTEVVMTQLLKRPVADDWSVAKPPLNSNGSLAKLELTLIMPFLCWANAHMGIMLWKQFRKASVATPNTIL